jgi:hypothetical protein
MNAIHRRPTDPDDLFAARDEDEYEDEYEDEDEDEDEGIEFEDEDEELEDDYEEEFDDYEDDVVSRRRRREDWE